MIGGGAVTALGFAAAERQAAMTPDLIPSVVSFVEETVRSWSEAVIAFGPYEFRGQSVGRCRRQPDHEPASPACNNLPGAAGSLIADLAKGTVNTFANGLLIFFVSLYISKDAPLLGRAIGDLAQLTGLSRGCGSLDERHVGDLECVPAGRWCWLLTIGAVSALR